MNTLLLAPELFRAEGGIARILRLYLKALCEIAAPAGRVDCLVLNDEPVSDPRITLYSGPALNICTGFRRGRIAFALAVFRYARGSDRIVCGHLHQLSLAWLAARFLPSMKYTLIAHGIEVWRPFTWIERRALLGADRIICISNHTRGQLLRFCRKLDPVRLSVVPNTLDPHLDSSCDPALSHGNEPVILTVARLAKADRYKGVDTLVEALPVVLRQFPSARLRVIGTGDDLPRLADLAARLGVASSVEFAGSVTDEQLQNEYASCSVFALPSRKEGFGLVFLEAMAHGKPCLGARAGGIPEVVTERVGLLPEYGDVSGIASDLIELLRCPPDPTVIRAHAETFLFPAFKRRIAAVLE